VRLQCVLLHTKHMEHELEMAGAWRRRGKRWQWRAVVRTCVFKGIGIVLSVVCGLWLSVGLLSA